VYEPIGKTVRQRREMLSIIEEIKKNNHER
jgi:hypothetical protein